MTSTPLRVAASRSTLSTPTPARPITRRSLGAFEQLGRHLRRAAHEQGVGVANFVGDLALGLGEIHDLPGRIGLQDFDDVVGNAVCY